MATGERSERLRVENVTGDAFFVVAAQDPPDIPDGAGQVCPQCNKTAWLRSRWCWHCKFDFDAASLPKMNATKLLWLSALLHAATAVSVGFAAVAHFMTAH